MTETDPESWKILNCGYCKLELTAVETYKEIGVVPLVERPLVYGMVRVGAREIPVCIRCVAKIQDGTLTPTDLS